MIAEGWVWPRGRPPPKRERGREPALVQWAGGRVGGEVRAGQYAVAVGTWRDRVLQEKEKKIAKEPNKSFIDSVYSTWCHAREMERRFVKFNRAETWTTLCSMT